MMAGLSENPVMLSCPLPQLAQTLPNEVIQAVCDAQYGVIPLINKKKMTHVVFMTDNAPQKSHATIRDGYATLLKARLADAHFYMKQDQKPLQHYADQLERMTFHADMGSMMDKTKRIAGIMHNITGMGISEDEAHKLAQLAKADLTTQMVAEFPSLQGIIGSHYYSDEENHNGEWAEAIRDHYHPLSMEDDLPASELGCALALADKLDTVVCFFNADKIPTGSKDPYGLRRTAIGIARILIERLPNCDLMTLISIYNRGDAQNAYLFIAEQMRRYLVKQYNYDSDHILAILTIEELSSVAEKKERIAVLHKASQDGQLDDFVNVYNRLCHFTKDSSELLRKHNATNEHSLKYHDHLCREDTERALHNHWKLFIEREDFTYNLNILSELYQPLEKFCSAVKVLDGDEALRANRIALLTFFKDEFDRLCNMKWLTDPTLAPVAWAR